MCVLDWFLVATGSGCLYFWSPSGCLCAQIPTDRNFSAMGMAWSPDGSSLVVMDKDRFCTPLYAAVPLHCSPLFNYMEWFQ